VPKLCAGKKVRQLWVFSSCVQDSEYSIDRGQRFQAIVDSAAKSAASAADSFQVSTMG
jgi:hypothetical protein